MSSPDLKTLCVELQCLGVRLDAPHTGRSGGAGPAEGMTIIIHDRYLNVPTASWYVTSSPYHAVKQEGLVLLYKNDSCMCEISFPQRPSFYNQKLPSGLSFQQVALLHGKDCFASTVYQDCRYWNTPQQCRFCGIGLSLKKNMTVLSKNPADLARAAACAAQVDGACHVTLTTGAWQDEARGLKHLCACISEIKKSSRMPVHVQVHPPQDLNSFGLLKAAGADTLGIHIEVSDEKLLPEMAPGKAELGLSAYTRCWESGVAAFGANQVSSFLIAGLGETAAACIAMVEHIAGLGVFPYLLPLRPIPQTPLADRKPPEPAYMASLYTATARILKTYGLASCKSKAGCVRCGACSCLSLFEEVTIQ